MTIYGSIVDSYVDPSPIFKKEATALHDFGSRGGTAVHWAASLTLVDVHRAFHDVNAFGLSDSAVAEAFGQMLYQDYARDPAKQELIIGFFAHIERKTGYGARKWYESVLISRKMRDLGAYCRDVIQKGRVS